NEGEAQNHGTLLANVFSYVPSRRPPRVDLVATSTELSRTDSSTTPLDEEAELKREFTQAQAIIELKREHKRDQILPDPPSSPF
ncbi:hypothetical protein Dimus_001496, partial [Dionaea muscipula]